MQSAKAILNAQNLKPDAQGLDQEIRPDRAGLTSMALSTQRREALGPHREMRMPESHVISLRECHLANEYERCPLRTKQRQP